MTTETENQAERKGPFEREPSRATRIQKGKEALPKGGILVRASKGDVLYVNFEHEPRLVRVVDPKVVNVSYLSERAAHEKRIAEKRAKLAKIAKPTKEQQVSEEEVAAFRNSYHRDVHAAFECADYTIEFYSGRHYGWLSTKVHANYPLIEHDHANAPAPTTTEPIGEVATSSRESKKPGAPKKVSAAVDPTTGFKPGSVGHGAGTAYRAAGGSLKKALVLVEKAFRDRWDASGHKYDPKAPGGQARLWVRLLNERDAKLYPALKNDVK